LLLIVTFNLGLLLAGLRLRKSLDSLWRFDKQSRFEYDLVDLLIAYEFSFTETQMSHESQDDFF
jgi:hypothetical protein